MVFLGWVTWQLVDLSKDFFFSYSYDLTQHLQHNMLASTAHTFPPPPCKVRSPKTPY